MLIISHPFAGVGPAPQNDAYTSAIAAALLPTHEPLSLPDIKRKSATDKGFSHFSESMAPPIGIFILPLPEDMKIL